MNLNEKIRNLLDEYGHANSERGVSEILNEWEKNKANIIATLSKHPNWDAENYRIVFDSDYTRGFDSEIVGSFFYWMQTAYKNTWTDGYTEPKINGMAPCDFEKACRHNKYLINQIDGIINNCDIKKEDILIGGKTLDVIMEEYEKTKDAYTSFSAVYFYDYDDDGNRIYLPRTYRERKEKLSMLRDLVMQLNTNIVNDEFVDAFKELYDDIPCAVGTRIMKIIGRVAKAYGVDKVVDMKTTQWVENGIIRQRERDMGYNGQIALLGDAINPLTIKRYTIISVNPLDYLTMSFGHRWASCHTIDKENRRDTPNTYEGQYCSGTLSYMLDEASVIFYTVDSDYEGNDFENADKMNRVTFHFNSDFSAMVQGRVYPDGRDGGDMSLASQFRAVMQKVITECTKENNLWILKKGTSNIGEYVMTRGTHYPDYKNYDDCTISLLKGKENYPTVKIGHQPICPDCGEVHYREDYLACEDCQDDENYIAHCERCGEGIREGDYDTVYCPDNDCTYCCVDCAEQDGVRYCQDDNEWHDEDNWYYDAYDGYCYHSIEVETEDGNFYHTTEHAELDGYMDTSDGEWYPSDEVVYDENRDTYFHINDDAVEIDDKWFEDEDSAKEAGFLKYGEKWYSESDMVTDAFTGEMIPEHLDGIVEVDADDETIYFASKENAINAGYILTIEGEWVKEAAA